MRSFVFDIPACFLPGMLIGDRLGVTQDNIQKFPGKAIRHRRRKQDVGVEKYPHFRFRFR